MPKPRKFSDIEHPLLLDYLQELTNNLRSIHSQVQDILPPKPEGPGHLIKPGDWVLVKNFQRSKNLEPRWKEPRQVLLSTRTAIKVEGHKNWVHATHCKRVPLPLPYDSFVRSGEADDECEQIVKFTPFSDARVTWARTEKESDDILQEATPPTHRLPNVTDPALLFTDPTRPGRDRYNLRPRKNK